LWGGAKAKRKETPVQFSRALICCSLFSAGCASIISGTTQLISVNSNVDGAQVVMNGQTLGKTPLTTQVKRGEQGTLTVEADGYTPFTFALNKKINNVFWVNIFCGGLFGSSTDYSTGAMYEYEPSTFFAQLQPENSKKADLDLLYRREAMRRFVLMNHEAVVHELSQGDGAYLRTILGALEIDEHHRETFVRDSLKAALASRNAIDFANVFMRQVN
jgi:PEGA domain